MKKETSLHHSTATFGNTLVKVSDDELPF